MLSSLGSFINTAIVFGTCIMFGALGEILTEKSGHLNLGIPGLIYLGAFGGWLGGYVFEKAVTPDSAFLLVFISILCACIFSLLGSLIYAFFTVTLRCNQNVTGLALTYLSVGICSFGGQYVINTASFSSGFAKASATAKAFSNCPNIAFKMGSLEGFGSFAGEAFLGYGFMIFVAIILAIVMHNIFFKTNVGLSLRSIGESPASADSQGISVNKYKYFAICIGGMIAGLGGVTYVMNYSNGIWATANSIESLGWLSVALVIFSVWKPLNAIWGSYLFAALFWLYMYADKLLGVVLDTKGSEALEMLPYVITIVVLIVISFRKKKELQPPASLGLSYFREER